MNKRDLTNLKKTLMQKRSELLNKANNVQRELSSGLDMNVGDEMDAASQNNDKEMFFEFAVNDKTTLIAINDAIAKIEKDIYDKCECCHNIIPIERLKAIPWTRYCIKCQEEAENPKYKK